MESNHETFKLCYWLSLLDHDGWIFIKCLLLHQRFYDINDWYRMSEIIRKIFGVFGSVLSRCMEIYVLIYENDGKEIAPYQN